MQFVATCNPEGPSHWVYQVFFVECMDEKTKLRDPDFAVYHVPIMENLHRLPPGYRTQMEKTLKNDDVSYRRLVRGEWVERKSGEGIFSMFWMPKRHVRGDYVRGEGLLPIPGHALYVGHDLGQVHSSVKIMQIVPVNGKSVWLVLDEVDKFYSRIIYKQLAKEVVDRLRFWNKKVGFEFASVFVAGQDSVNQWRPTSGSYDSRDFEIAYNQVYSQYAGTSMHKRIKLIGAPRGSGSIASRVRLVNNKLADDSLFVSATCKNATDMFNSLIADKDDPEVPIRTHPFIESFDAISYPMALVDLQPGRANRFIKTGHVAPSIIRCGSA
jgi:hypothetical protein